MTISFAQGLGDLAGDDVRRWRAANPPTVRTARSASLGVRVIRMLKRIGRLEPMGRCRQPLSTAHRLIPVSVSGPTHAAPHSRHPS